MDVAYFRGSHPGPEGNMVFIAGGERMVFDRSSGSGQGGQKDGLRREERRRAMLKLVVNLVLFLNQALRSKGDPRLKAGLNPEILHDVFDIGSCRK